VIHPRTQAGQQLLGWLCGRPGVLNRNRTRYVQAILEVEAEVERDAMAAVAAIVDAAGGEVRVSEKVFASDPLRLQISEEPRTFERIYRTATTERARR